MAKYGYAVAAVGLVAGAASAQTAQTWSATIELNKDRSPVSCQSDGTKVNLIVANGKLSYNYGSEKIEVPVGPDGAVKQDVKSASGARGTLTGQVSTKTLEFLNANSSCRYSFIPG